MPGVTSFTYRSGVQSREGSGFAFDTHIPIRWSLRIHNNISKVAFRWTEPSRFREFNPRSQLQGGKNAREHWKCRFSLSTGWVHTGLLTTSSLHIGCLNREGVARDLALQELRTGSNQLGEYSRYWALDTSLAYKWCPANPHSFGYQYHWSKYLSVCFVNYYC